MTKLFSGLENYDTATIYQVALEDINPGSERRIRRLKKSYKDDPDFISLREDMKQQGLINPIQLDTNLVIVAGHRRYFAALDLGWKTISASIKEYTEEERFDCEFGENLNRVNFTDYETYVGIAKRKRLYDKNHPEVVRGKYDRDKMNNSIINESDSFMDQRSEAFTEHYARRYGLNRRTLEIKIQIGDAILDELFHPKTINDIEDGKLTQKQILSRLRERRRSKKVFDANNRNQETKTSSGNKITEKKEINQFQKLEKIIDLKNSNPEVLKQYKDVEKRKKSVNEAFDNTQKMVETKRAIFEESKRAHTEAILNYTKKKKVDEKKPIPKESDTDKAPEVKVKEDNMCKTCPKANNVAIPCVKCGYPTPKVICDHDIVKGKAKLRNPENKRCSNAPKHELSILS